MSEIVLDPTVLDPIVVPVPTSTSVEVIDGVVHVHHHYDGGGGPHSHPATDLGNGYLEV